MFFVATSDSTLAWFECLDTSAQVFYETKTKFGSFSSTELQMKLFYFGGSVSDAIPKAKPGF